MATEIDSLQVKIKANAKSATDSLRSLASALGRVKTALTGMKDGVSVTDRLSKSFNEMNGALNTISTGGIKKLQKLANALDGYAAAVKNLKGVGGGSIKQNLKAIDEALTPKKEKEFTGKVLDTASAVDVSVMSKSDKAQLKEDIQKIKETGKAVEEAGKKAKHAAGMFGKFLKSIGRIMLYRAIRSALKGIAEAFETGLKHAYYYSQQTGDLSNLAKTLDHVKSKTTQMVNQLGAFWGEVKQFVAPAIEWIADKITTIAEYLTEFFAALNGDPTYQRAKLQEVAWDDASDALKKYKHQLLGLDELNVLSDDKNNTKKTEYEKAKTEYEDIAVNEKLLNTLGKIKDFTLDISDVIFKWDDLTGEDICKKLIAGLSGLAGAVVGFTIGGVPGAVVGSLVGIAIGLGIDSLLPLVWSITGDDLGKIFATGIAGLTGAVVGFEIGGPIGALVGTITGVGISLTISSLLPIKSDTQYGAQGLFDLLSPALGALAGGIIGWTLGKTTKGGKLKGAFLGMTIGAEVGLVLNNILKATNGTVIDGQNLFDLLETALYALAGGIIGWTYGGAKGVFVGIGLGAQVGLVMNKLNKFEFGKEYGASTLFKLLNPALKGLTGGLIGFKLATKAGKSGITGMFIGMSIGVSVGLIMQKFEEAKQKGIVKQAVMESILAVLNGLVVAGMLFYLTGGSMKAASVGLSIGVSVTLWLQSLDWSSVAKSIYEKGQKYKNSGNLIQRVWGELLTEVSEDSVPQGWTGGSGTISSYMLDDKHGGVHGKFDAMGGVETRGTLFYAGEAGPEFVGSMGNSSAVANTGQMTDAIYKAAYMGMSRALAENGGNGLAGFEPATTDDLFIAMRKKASNYNRMTGNSAFA